MRNFLVGILVGTFISTTTMAVAQVDLDTLLNPARPTVSGMELHLVRTAGAAGVGTYTASTVHQPQRSPSALNPLAQKRAIGQMLCQNNTPTVLPAACDNAVMDIFVGSVNGTLASGGCAFPASR